ncbi:MAG: hypothetical protein M3O86_05610 [Actinomycetota bacterium]|nr:hypothetical protein [Actinomycetota bacterium]
MSLTAVHGYIVGFAIIGAWATVCGWSLALRLARYRETPTFWKAVSVAQVLLALQLLLGVALLVLGERPGPAGGAETVAFHLAYGLVFPLVVLVVGHRTARAGRYDPHSVFALVGLVIFGLTARAWMVGVAGA